MTKTISLQVPITKGERTITEISLCEPKAKHLLSLDEVNGEIASVFALTAALSGESEALLQELSIIDFETIKQELDSLLTVEDDLLGKSK